VCVVTGNWCCAYQHRRASVKEVTSSIRRRWVHKGWDPKVIFPSLCNCLEFPSARWHCRLGTRKNIRPIKNWSSYCQRFCFRTYVCRHKITGQLANPAPPAKRLWNCERGSWCCFLRFAVLHNHDCNCLFTGRW